MKKSILSWLLFSVVGIGSVACSENEKAEAETEETETETEETEDPGNVDTETEDTEETETDETEETEETDETDETETETETEEPEPRMDCTYEDLILQVEVRDDSGICTTCDATDWMLADGLLYNPCGNDVTFNTPTNCYVVSGTLAGPTNMNITPNCPGAAREYTVEAGRTILQPSSIGWINGTTPVDPGEYTLTLDFGSPFNQSASFDFTAYH